MTTPGPSPLSIWANAYAPPAPDTVPCAGAVGIFDLHLDGEHLTDIRNGRRYVRTPFRQQVAVALSYCATCPLATRRWCEDTVRPRQSRANIVTAGAVWVNGKRVWDVAAQERYEAGEAA